MTGSRLRTIEYLSGAGTIDPASVVSPAAVRVRNLDYLFARTSDYPLAPPVVGPIDGVAAFAVDMDGTSTTTEPLALHSLEYMVRRFTDRPTVREWAGLDPVNDYPHVIGHSNQHHTTFLLDRYQADFRPAALRDAFLESLAWTLAHLPDTSRARHVRETARLCGLGQVILSDAFRAAGHQGQRQACDLSEAQFRAVLGASAAAFRADDSGARVRAALDVYYMRYHSILLRVQHGDAAALAAELLGDSRRRLIEPMPGYAAFVAVVKGWLGRDVAALRDELVSQYRTAEKSWSDDNAGVEALIEAAARFEQSPAKLALVTASIGFEAAVVMDEVRVRMADEVRRWPVAAVRRERILANLAERERVFDAFVTADDACEHRLKPHPDLYSLALHRMGIEPRDYARCVGVEDTEPGIVAVRAAGIGCAVALPNHDTRRQEFRAATHVLSDGLPELLLGQHAMQRRRSPDSPSA
ncbi:MAG: hypothetical protein AMXMBFR47_37600 [Planctomycetota bacterium]